MDQILSNIFNLFGQIIQSPLFQSTGPSGSVSDQGLNILNVATRLWSFLQSFADSSLIFWFKIFALLLTFLLLLGLIVLIDKIEKLRQPKNSTQETPSYEVVLKKYNEEWQQVLSYANALSESEWKLAVIEADNIFDSALVYLGYPGETMGERLMAITSQMLPSLNRVWDAHKLRNTIVHDLGTSIRHEQVIEATTAFERGLRELNLLD